MHRKVRENKNINIIFPTYRTDGWVGEGGANCIPSFFIIDKNSILEMFSLRGPIVTDPWSYLTLHDTVYIHPRHDKLDLCFFYNQTHKLQSNTFIEKHNLPSNICLKRVLDVLTV